MTKEEIKEFVQEWMNSHEEDTFIKNEHGVVLYSSGHTSLNLTCFFEDLLTEFIESENERLKAEREWILCDDDMPEVDETVWITNGCGWTALGCLVQCEGGYCWAVTNGIIYEEDGKIVSECELDDDYDVVYWHRLPKPPKQ